MNPRPLVWRFLALRRCRCGHRGKLCVPHVGQNDVEHPFGRTPTHPFIAAEMSTGERISDR